MDQNDNKISGDSGTQQPPLTSSSDEHTASYRNAPAKPVESASNGSVGSGGGVSRELPPQFGRYRVVEKLGNGGMGTVYLVENIELEREEALKVPHFSLGDDREVRERFVREAKSAAKLDHAHLCPIYDVGEQDGIYYLTMRYLKGKLLSEYTGKAQPIRKSVEIVIKLAQAMEAAHVKGIIHRDLKPGNIMMVGGLSPVVMDFGLAKLIRQPDQKLTQTGSSLGTPAYMPPEQIKGQLEQMGPASDVYSLGVILFQLLTGHLPFEGPTVAVVYGKILHTEPTLPSSLVPGLSPVLDRICLKAMAKEPAERYSSMKAFAAALLEYLRSTPATEGIGNLASAAAENAAAFHAATIPPRRPPGANAGFFQTPTVPLKPRHNNPATDERVREPPAAQRDWKSWLGGGCGAAVLLGIVFWALATRHESANRPRFIRQTFDDLQIGMTLKEMERILGPSRIANRDLLRHTSASGESHLAAWRRAIDEGKVRWWHNRSHDPQPHFIYADQHAADHYWILASFADAPSSDSRVDVLLGNGEDFSTSGWYGDQKPADKWMVSKDNFLKLKLGMTLKELENVIGCGEPVSSLPSPMMSLSNSTSRRDWTDEVLERWIRAVNEYRVYQWKGNDWTPAGEHNMILAAFSAPPSANSAASSEALSYRDGRWDEDKGALSGGASAGTLHVDAASAAPMAQREQNEEEVMVEWQGTWYAATILQTVNGKSLVHYDGWDSKWDEWVFPDRIRQKVSGELE